MPQLGSRKSRRGCLQCKRRRVKCDEVVPCGACRRRNEQCSFLAPNFQAGNSDTALDPSIPSNTEEWAFDLELMYHYATTVYNLIGVRENVLHLWREYIPKQAIKHPFLMHGLLALAALHLAYLRPELSSQHLQTFDKHQAVALEKFRSILSSSVEPTHADALFALAATLSISSMARTCTQVDAAALDVDTITELIILTRGVKNIIDITYNQIRAGPMSALLERQRCPEAIEIILPPSVSARFEAVEQWLVMYGMDQNALQYCQTALTELQEIYRNIAYISATENVELGVISRWQVMVPMDYVKLIQARNPPALIILAHYVATMTVVRTAWYSQDWAEYALRVIDQALDSTMQHWIHWPMEQVHDRLSVLRVPSANREAVISVH